MLVAIQTSQLPSLTVFGIVVGAVYGLLALGLVVIYRGTRVFNLGHGVIAMAGAYLFSGLVETGIPRPFAFVMAAGACAVSGLVIERFIMRPLAKAGTSPKVVATLGVFITIQAVVIMGYGAAPRFAPTLAPDGTFTMPGSFEVSYTQVVVVIVSLVLFGAIYHLYNRTELGLQMQAVAIDPEAAAIQGIDVGAMSSLSWVIGCTCAGVAGILLAPLLILDTVGLPLIVIESFAAALIGGLTSFPLTLAGAMVLGLSQTLSRAFTSNQGTKSLIAFVLILAALSFRRGSVDFAGVGVMLDTRHIPTVLPAPQFRISAARRTVAGAPAAGLLAGLVIAPALLNPHWTFLAASMLVYALVLLSFVVLYGWLGQVSFVQAELMGVGAFTAATLTAGGTVPAWLAALIAMAVTVPTAMVVAIPSLRLRGFNVSLATLAFAVCLDNLILNTQTVSRLDIGQPSGRPAWGGNVLTDVQFYYLAAAIFGVAAIGITWLRRSNLGRSFRAIKDSEVAAEASGLDVWKYKLIGWAISSALAGLGGALIAYLLGIVNFRPFSVTQSLFLFAVAVIGGTTGVAGALVGAMFFVFVPEMLSYVETTGKYTYLIDGAGVLLAVLFFPKGLAAVGGQVRTAIDWLRRRRDVAEVT